MKKWKLWTGIILLFLAGVCIGVIGTGLYVRHLVESVLQEGPPAVGRLVTGKLSRELDLSDSQQVAVGKAVGETQRRLHELRHRHWPETDRILTDGIEQIKPDLTPEQQKKLDALYDRLKERWRMRAQKY